MKELLQILILTLLISCNQTTISKEQKNANINKLVDSSTVLYFKDTTKYSSYFLNEFKNTHKIYKTISFNNDTIILNSNIKQIIYFPIDLQLNKTVVYKATTFQSKMSLRVKKINYSTIHYDFSNGSFFCSGNVHLDPRFYLKASNQFIAKDGKTYIMNRYNDTTKNNLKYLIVGQNNIEQLIFYYQHDGVALPKPIVFYKE